MAHLDHHHEKSASRNERRRVHLGPGRLSCRRPSDRRYSSDECSDPVGVGVIVLVAEWQGCRHVFIKAGPRVLHGTHCCWFRSRILWITGKEQVCVCYVPEITLYRLRIPKESHGFFLSPPSLSNVARLNSGRNGAKIQLLDKEEDDHIQGTRAR